jgi:hypothetical protein
MENGKWNIQTCVEDVAAREGTATDSEAFLNSPLSIINYPLLVDDSAMKRL